MKKQTRFRQVKRKRKLLKWFAPIQQALFTIRLSFLRSPFKSNPYVADDSLFV